MHVCTSMARSFGTYCQWCGIPANEMAWRIYVAEYYASYYSDYYISQGYS